MKKIIFLAVIAAAFSFSANAQQGEVHENTPLKAQQPVFAQIPPAVVINNSNIVNNGMGIVGQAPRVRTRVVYRDRPVYITNNNFYYDTTNKVKEPPPVQPEKNDSKDRAIWWNYYNNSLIGSAILIFALLGLLMLLGYWLFSMYRKNHPINPSATSHTHTHTHTHAYPAATPKTEPIKVDPYIGLEEARADVKSTGGSLRVYDNGYKVKFSKPTLVEKKSEGAIDLTKKDKPAE